jgi:hypothetical protein
LAKRKDFNLEHAVQKTLGKDHKSTHDCQQVQELRAELEAIKVTPTPPAVVFVFLRLLNIFS